MIDRALKRVSGPYKLAMRILFFLGSVAQLEAEISTDCQIILMILLPASPGLWKLDKNNPKLKEKTGFKISNSFNISASNWVTELRKKESSWSTYIGRNYFPKLYLSLFSFKTGLYTILYHYVHNWEQYSMRHISSKNVHAEWPLSSLEK